MSKFYKNYAKKQIVQTKRLIVNPDERIKKLHFEISIDDIEQEIEIDNRNFSNSYHEIADSVEWNGNGIELNICVYPIPPEKRVSKNMKEYAVQFVVTAFSKNNPETPQDKQSVKELFMDIADSADENRIHIHNTDYFCLEE